MTKKKKKDITSEDGKIILRINQKGRNWVISAFSNTSAEEILSASAENGSDAFYRRGLYTIGDVFENVNPDNTKSLFYDITNIKFARKVRQPANTGSSTGARHSDGLIQHQPSGNTDNIAQSSENANLRASIAPVYTGSAADYSQPSLQFVNSGEGAQVYGWRLYGSSGGW